MLSTPYSDIHHLRSTGKAGAALELLKSHPPQSDEDAFEAVVCLFVVGDRENAVHVCRTRPWALAWARQMCEALVKLLAEDNAQEALTLARGALRDPAIGPDAQAFYLMLLQANERLGEAYDHVRAQRTPPAGETFCLTVMAEVAAATEDWIRAYQLACGVIAADNENYRALIVLSNANFAFKNFHESLGNALCANQISRASLPATLQLMRCHNMLGDYYATVAAYDALSSEDATLPQIQIELGTAYAGLDCAAQATAAYQFALTATPPPIEAIRALQKMFIESGDKDALETLSSQYANFMDNNADCVELQALEKLRWGLVDETARLLRRSHDLHVQRSEAYRQLPWPVPEPWLRHDYEQLDMLARRGKLGASGKAALQVLKPYYEQARDPQQTFAPEGHAADALKKALCDIHYFPEPPFTGEALGRNDYPALEHQYHTENLVVIDNFLSANALTELRRFSEEATVWKMYNPGGYIGAVLMQGYAPKVLLTIADELRRLMPTVIRDYALFQAWGFKYDQRMQGIATHADFAKVNINFWVTPEAACEDTATGGMVVYNHPVPKTWTFADYNSNPEKLRTFVKVHGAKPQRVPYRENRCVMFDSSLIHVTDELHFKPGYENRRINITLLFGRARSSE